MGFLVQALGVVVLALSVAFDGKLQVWDFDRTEVGAVPSGFRVCEGAWEVKEGGLGERGRSLFQSSKGERSAFNVCLIDDVSVKDLDLSVQFEAIAGEVDQGGGVVWRARDGRNYYIARYNPLEDNLRVYHVVEGKRTQLGNADIERKEGWYHLRVLARGDVIEVHLDGKKYLEVRDSTFPEAGKIGLWSKADAQTRFDDARLVDLAEDAR